MVGRYLVFETEMEKSKDLVKRLVACRKEMVCEASA